MHPDRLELHTERLVLRPMEERDAVALFPLINDADVALTMLTVPHPYPQDQLVPWIRASREALKRRERYEMAVVLKETGNPIGACALNPNWEHMRAELGYWIGKKYWGQGYITEAAARMVRFGFESLELERIFAYCFDFNPASIRVLEKVGLKYEGRLRHHVRKKRKFLDLLCYGIIRSDYESTGK